MDDICGAALHLWGLSEMMTDIVHDMNLPPGTPFRDGIVPLCDVIAAKAEEIMFALESRE